jgi:monovalent cation:H+ antiporter-2, CPA2 family
MGIAEDFILIILFGLFFGFIAHKLKIPILLGYLISGIIIGPNTGGITIKNTEEVFLLAEIGVALLLFSIGLELSINEIKSVKFIALIGTPLQILLSIGLGFSIGHYLQLDWKASLIFGLIISLSSTMVVIKSLMNSNLMNTISSKVMIGILIAQDLAAVPMIILIQQINQFSENSSIILNTILKGFSVILMIVVLGVYIIPRILRIVVKINSRELFLLTITTLGLGVGLLTHLAGLSFALGAFITGMVLNGSDYSHKAMSDILPLRDIFGLIFFSSIGMLFNPSFFYDNINTILLLTIIVHIGKFIIFSSTSLLFKYYNIVPIAVGFGLSQIGEFSFVLAKTAFQENIFDQKMFSIILSTSVLTMFLSPFLLMLVNPSYKLITKIINKNIIIDNNLNINSLNNHTIIAGGGRVANSIANIFQKLNFSFVIVENDFNQYEIWKKNNINCIFGDATSESILSSCLIEKAEHLIITIPDIMSTKDIIYHSKILNPNIKIIARCNHPNEIKELYDLKIFEVIQPEFEASMEIIRKTLLSLNFPITAIQTYIDDIRKEKYNFKSYLNEKEFLKLKNAYNFLEIDWINIDNASRIINKSIKELEIRKNFKISVVGIIRSNHFIQNPDTQTKFFANDYIAILGSKDEKNEFINFIKGKKEF